MKPSTPSTTKGKIFWLLALSVAISIFFPQFLLVAFYVLMAFLVIKRDTRPTFWKVYFWVTAVLGIFGHAINVVTNPTMEQCFSLPAFALALCALYGYAHKRQLGPQVMWKFAFLVFVLLGVAASYLSPSDNLTEYDNDIIILLAVLPLAIPALVAFFNYAFLAKHIWKRQDTHLTRECHVKSQPPR